jgi:hypothetical protein
MPVAKNSVFLFAKNSVLLFTDYTIIDPKVVHYHIKYQYEFCFYLELFMADGNDHYLQVRWQFLLADSAVNGVMS